MEVKVAIIGDLYPSKVKAFPKLMENDFCVANLECAITKSDVAIKKDGPSLKVLPDRVEVLKSLGVDLVGLANNHVCDFGEIGLNETISILDRNKIFYAGFPSEKASFTKIIGNKRISFYFVSEHQYNYFPVTREGVNLLELDRCLNEVKELKKNSDVVFVMFHGGKEYYAYPTPIQYEVCHKFIDSGADIVICQHSHCVGCEEKYKNSTIVYGQGNFVFPYRENEHFKFGLIIEAVISENNLVSLNYVPVIHEVPETVEIAPKEKADKILSGFYDRSKALKNTSVDELYSSYVEENGFDFLYKLLNKSKLYIRLDTSRFFKNSMLKRYIRKNQKYFAYLFNYFNCETHIEYIKAIIYKQLNRGDRK